MPEKDDRTYIRVHDGMVDHPKIVELSDRSFRLLITLWSYSSRHLTDGRVPPKVAHSLGTRATRELVNAGLLLQHDDGYECRHYLQHQRSRARVQEIKEIRREAGKKGGRPKANPKQAETNLLSKTQSQNNPETETETDIPPVVPLSDTAAADETGTTARKRARQLPDDWKPNERHLSLARERGVDPATELATFTDHAHATGRVMKDWDAAFSMWLRKARPSLRAAEPDVPHYWRKQSGGLA